MSSTISCSTVNDIFERETSRFNVDIWERYSVDGPWGRLVRVGKFPLGMGTTLSELTVERVLSGNFENSWANVSTSSGLGSPNNVAGCNPTPNNLAFGQTVRSWQLQTQSYQTPCICLDDLKTAFQIENQVGKTVDQLTQLTKTVLDNRRRSEYLRISGKLVAGDVTQTVYQSADGIGTAVPNALYYNTNTPLPVPTAKLSQDLLDVLRVQLIRDGAGHNSLGKENGVPVLGLITSPETSRDLLRSNSELRQDIRYATPSELIAPLGVDRSAQGFYHMIDLELPRFNYGPIPAGQPRAGTTGWYQVYPFIQSNATNGVTWEVNPAYNVAPFEVSYIFHPDVYEESVQQVGPSIPGAPFEDFPYYYSGQFFWLNIRDAVNNPLGKIGRWLAIFQSGSRPIAPYLGRAILHKRCPYDLSFSGCSYS
jgi:hypothetical protein